MSPEFKIFLTSMSPVGELRASIPLGVGIFHLPLWEVFLISVIGNILIVAILLVSLERVSLILMRSSQFFNKWLNWLFEKTKKRHKRKFELWKEFALIFLVGLPLPFTGGWTGSLCAFLFRIPFKKALTLIAIGVILAGVIVSFFTLEVVKLKNVFLKI